MNSTNVDFIGGGLQDDEIEVKTIEDFQKNTLKELKEETNITHNEIESISGMGIVFSSATNILFFYKVILNIDSAELKEIFKNRAEDEMADLMFIKPEEYSTYLRTLPSYRPLIADLLN